MKNQWDERVYVDLYSGAGISRIQGTNRFLKGSPVIALTVPAPFDKYIFCEEDPRLLEALKTRVKRIAPTAEVHFVAGSCDIARAKQASSINFNVSTLKDRMDGRNMEPGSWLHEDQPRLQALLCGAVRREVSRRAGTPFGQGFDFTSRAREAGGAAALE